MIKLPSLGLLLVNLLSVTQTQSAPYASQVVDYQSGILPANLSAYTNATAALGEPSRLTPGAYGGPVDPFNPPYLDSQLVSVGQGGSLTVRLETAASDSPDHWQGVDFIVYGNAGFIITNGQYTGAGITDGHLFGAAEAGTVRISVSVDNAHFFLLSSALSPVMDGYYPTDGSGHFGVPVSTKLGPADFAGQDLNGIRALYAGSAGGTGYDLDWAVDAQGNPVVLDTIQYVRLEVLNGHVDIDGFAVATAIPEPGTVGLLLLGLCGLMGRWGQVRGILPLRRNGQSCILSLPEPAFPTGGHCSVNAHHKQTKR